MATHRCDSPDAYDDAVIVALARLLVAEWHRHHAEADGGPRQAEDSEKQTCLKNEAPAGKQAHLMGTKRCRRQKS